MCIYIYTIPINSWNPTNHGPQFGQPSGSALPELSFEQKTATVAVADAKEPRF